MKEAAGEANMTIVTIVLIAIVLAAGTLIVTNIMNGMSNNKQSICSQLGGAYNKNECVCPSGSKIAGTNLKKGSVTDCNGNTVTVE